MKKYWLWIVALISVLQGSLALSATTSYQYDALGRLTTVTQGSSKVTYIYDPAGNRTSKQISGVTPTVISMGSSTAQVHQGSVVFTVNVGSSSTTGTVNFYDGATFIGSAPIVGGVASVEIIGLPIGAHSITVSYDGNSSDPANSISFPINVINIDWLPAVLQILLN